MTDITGHGPYDTREQALTDIDNPHGHTDRAWRYERLTQAVTAAGAGLGEYDQVIIGWLAGWEPDTVQVIVALIGRAHAAGRNQLAAEMTDLQARIGALETADRHAAPIEINLTQFRRTPNGGTR